MLACRTIALALTLVLVPTLAWAGCNERRIGGDYRLYATTHLADETVWTACDVRVARDGTLESDFPCVQRNVAGDEIESILDGGAIAVTRDCEVTGNIVIAGNESLITSAIMSYDRSIIEGMGVNLDDSTLRFSAVRKR